MDVFIIIADEKRELAEIEAESIGWLPLGEGTYFHHGRPNDDEIVITVTGVPDAAMLGANVLLIGY